MSKKNADLVIEGKIVKFDQGDITQSITIKDDDGFEFLIGCEGFMVGEKEIAFTFTWSQDLIPIKNRVKVYAKYDKKLKRYMLRKIKVCNQI